MIPHRPFGKTDLLVSGIGFGTAPLGNVYGDITDTECIRAVHHAVERGINFFDTAPRYGDTLAETRLGMALRGKRDQVIVATKAGHYDGQNGQEFDFSPAGIRQSLEGSLRRLQTETVDLFQLHDIEFEAIDTIVNESLPTLHRLKEEGKVRYIGITGYPLHMLKAVAERVPVDSIQSYCHYNLLNTTLTDSLLPFVKQHRIGMINSSLLHMGMLTQQGAPKWHPAPDEVHDAAARLREFALEHHADLAQLALQFAFANREIDVACVGIRSVDEVDQNLALFDSPGDLDLLARIQPLLEPSMNVNWEVGLPENHEPGALPQRKTGQRNTT
jgi:L-galactose dehydrogenase